MMNEVDPWEIIEKLRLQHKEEIHEQWMPLVAEYREQVNTLQSRLEELNQKVDELEKENASLKQDAARYRFVKTMQREMLLAWRGMYGFADEAIDAAMQANK